MIVVYLQDTQERTQLLASHPDSDAKARHWAEGAAFAYLQTHEVDSESRVVTALVLEKVEVGDFVMRGATPP